MIDDLMMAARQSGKSVDELMREAFAGDKNTSDWKALCSPSAENVWYGCLSHTWTSCSAEARFFPNTSGSCPLVGLRTNATRPQPGNTSGCLNTTRLQRATHYPKMDCGGNIPGYVAGTLPVARPMSPHPSNANATTASCSAMRRLPSLCRATHER